MRQSRLRSLAAAISQARGDRLPGAQQSVAQRCPKEQEQLDAIDVLSPDFTALEWGTLFVLVREHPALVLAAQSPNPYSRVHQKVDSCSRSQIHALLCSSLPKQCEVLVSLQIVHEAVVKLSGDPHR